MAFLITLAVQLLLCEGISKGHHHVIRLARESSTPQGSALGRPAYLVNWQDVFTVLVAVVLTAIFVARAQNAGTERCCRGEERHFLPLGTVVGMDVEIKCDYREMGTGTHISKCRVRVLPVDLSGGTTAGSSQQVPG